MKGEVAENEMTGLAYRGSWFVRLTWYEKSSKRPSGGTKLITLSLSHRSREMHGCSA